ncbi:MAG: 1-(5-phosphoribosyl)-5-[(5-phosphoribosylamino)methylideneamino]imidazole-4-carboxamide isomerase [Planctomycetaceae bacterium]|nr:MAG: 1-(5-phosphoribosyl)-5-[(5-phosphoribosylamino)methylideneamino]imidazole-4-carboxamide isomerase [Planctomycetaceae bacterium]
MQVWPAIDLRGGNCVRLLQGDYARETVFGHDPAAMAQRWVSEGAEYLHLVDLDGAREGRSVNFDAIESIVSVVDIPCELGGGIRDERTIERMLSLGLARLVIGTKAVKEPGWLRQVCGRFPGKLAVGIDARDGRVASEGWLESSQVVATELARSLADQPIAAVIYTDIARDGMMSGPNLAAMAEMRRAVEIPVIASGGITTADDVRRLAEAGMDGCIIGRALYEGSLTLDQALAAADQGTSG